MNSYDMKNTTGSVLRAELSTPKSPRPDSPPDTSAPSASPKRGRHVSRNDAARSAARQNLGAHLTKHSMPQQGLWGTVPASSRQHLGTPSWMDNVPRQAWHDGRPEWARTLPGGDWRAAVRPPFVAQNGRLDHFTESHLAVLRFSGMVKSGGPHAASVLTRRM
eukprot:gnl/MRDRNA2_/MRDRNA2_109380_c0_seq1.p2 gnl/MRDRNA2_/MRDRNA2_109380_c0~~gnl/MRDRNA2_/MRDRNA2_109380_c0_seq1.p2  ORF type:complete len:163 (+),score=12.24 gnl/MRDRNA2_/MRDRNA2_109380_c0_seq1:71-559(+)